MMGNTYTKIAETKNEWQRQVSSRPDFEKLTSRIIINIFTIIIVGPNCAGGGTRGEPKGTPRSSRALQSANGRRLSSTCPSPQSNGRREGGDEGAARHPEIPRQGNSAEAHETHGSKQHCPSALHCQHSPPTTTSSASPRVGVPARDLKVLLLSA